MNTSSNEGTGDINGNPAAQHATPKRLIKRYANRKLYDTRESRYITLPQIAELVRAGGDVKVIDNKSKEDLTSVTLAQVIYYEEERKDAGSKPSHSIHSLRSLIQSEGHRLVASIRDKTSGRFPGMKGSSGDTESDSESHTDTDESKPKRSVIDYPKELFEELQGLVDDRMRQLVASAISPVHQLQSEVQRLATRIEELEGRLKGVAQRRSRKDEPAQLASDQGPAETE